MNFLSISTGGVFQRRAAAAVSNYILSCGWRSISSSAAPKRVGTHDGKFHCDEALGCFMIRRAAKFHDADIIRSRDPLVLDKLDAVLDVGGVYDPSRDRYDHHQSGSLMKSRAVEGRLVQLLKSWEWLKGRPSKREKKKSGLEGVEEVGVSS